MFTLLEDKSNVTRPHSPSSHRDITTHTLNLCLTFIKDNLKSEVSYKLYTCIEIGIFTRLNLVVYIQKHSSSIYIYSRNAFVCRINWNVKNNKISLVNNNDSYQSIMCTINRAILKLIDSSEYKKPVKCNRLGNSTFRLNK